MSVNEKETVWTISNGLSAARIFLLIPTAYFLISKGESNHLFAFILIVIGALTDFLDGYVARKLSQVTDFGKILDPLADKIALGVLALLLAVQQILPVWFVVSVALRDILIFSGGIYIQRKKGIVVQSNWLGKWTAGILALCIGIAVLGLEQLSMIQLLLLYVSTLMLLISFISYAKRFLELK